MSSLRKNLSFSVKIAKNELSNIWAMTYQPVNPNPKLFESFYKNELEQMIKDIEDSSKTDYEITERYRIQFYADELKQKFRDTKIGQVDYSLLHLAAKNCRNKFSQFLLNEIKIDKDVQCKSRSTPLHILIKSNVFKKSDCELPETMENSSITERLKSFKETFQVFIEKSCDINAQDELGFTALHNAVLKNNYGAVLQLLDVSDIDLYLEDKKNYTPLHIACKYGTEEVAELLIDRIESDKLVNMLMFDHGSSLPLHLACRNKAEKYTIVKKILEKIKYSQQTRISNYLDAILKKEDNNGQVILHLAIENNHLNIVELLFKEYHTNKDLKDEHSGNLPIHLAAKNGSLEMFYILQKYDAISFKLNDNLENALHIASFYNKSKFINEFLKYEKFLMTNKHENENFIPCMCICEMENDYVASTRARDKKQYTPLLTALASRNQKCVEELISNEYTELNARDKDGNSIYHICTEYDNSESLKFLFQNYSDDIVYSKNNFEDTILHCACRNGNLEMVKLILNKLYESNISMETILFGKNRDGQTCFHIACIKGYYNIIEYFLKDKKLNVFLEHIDNNSNSGLHLATLNGHSTIVSLLIEHGADVDAKNEDNITALDISCRKGFFEISKNIIGNYTTLNQNEKQNDFPLHVACYEGAHEVVKLLLLKGVAIDRLNNENKNCLDIAISRGHREVIRILLNDENWHKLIRLNNRDDTDDDTINIVSHLSKSDVSEQTTRNKIKYFLLKKSDSSSNTKLEENNSTTGSTGGGGGGGGGGGNNMPKKTEIKFVENPQLFALFENKMWDMFKIVLDKCVTEKEMDFTKIDIKVKSISKHTLMLIARSGQENLLKHPTTKMLLQLKWRYIPRFAFYFNLIFYMTFLFLFSLYTIELSQLGGTLHNYLLINNNNNNINNNYSTNNNESTQLFNQTSNNPENKLKILFYKDSYKDSTSLYKKNNPGFYVLLILLLNLQLIKELFQIFFLDGLSYFLSLQNIIEIFTYITALISLLSTNYYTQSAYGSIAVLFAFILFPLFIQKLKMFGLYVVAFRRTLANSAKFFPIFLIMFTGFVLSFNIRTNFGVGYFNSTGYSIIRTITMVVGELDTAKMGLFTDSFPNYLIYVLFIGLMCTIVLNLFVGIAVGEIKTVLDEADIQQTSMRIMFVLKVQSAINPLSEKEFVKNFLNMNFKKYNYETENKLIKIIDTLFKKIFFIFSSKEQRINLSDPQKRLEDSFHEISRITSEQIKSIKFGFSNQITDVESKLFNSQRRLQDSLIEFSNNTNEQIATFKDEAKQFNGLIKLDLGDVRKQIEDAILSHSKKTSDEFIYSNKYFNTKLNEFEIKLSTQNSKLQNVLIEVSKKANFQFESVKESCVNQYNMLRTSMTSSQKIIEDWFFELDNHNKQNFISNETTICNRIDDLKLKLNDYSNEIKVNIGDLNTTTTNHLKIVNESLNEQNRNLNMLNEFVKKLLLDSLNQLKQNTEIEFKSVKTNTNYLEDKLNMIQTQMHQLHETMVKMNESIMNLHNKIDQTTSPF